ncbi:MAG TPA: hypothetical protein VFZ58_01095 [Candidatus Saccharimonadales bacterium]
MIVFSLFRWWYSEGLLGQLKAVERRISGTADYFSVGLLLKTLFSPFRQISAGQVQGPLAVKWRAWLDKLISRFVGAAFRIVTIIAGLATLCLQLLIGLVLLLGWALLPLLPVAGLLLTLSGWLPWSK